MTDINDTTWAAQEIQEKIEALAKENEELKAKLRLKDMQIARVEQNIQALNDFLESITTGTHA